MLWHITLACVTTVHIIHFLFVIYPIVVAGQASHSVAETHPGPLDEQSSATGTSNNILSDTREVWLFMQLCYISLCMIV